jgi:hypothetical protein
MSMPPSVLTMINGREVGAVQQHGEVKFLFDLYADASSSVCTCRPSARFAW